MRLFFSILSLLLFPLIAYGYDGVTGALPAASAEPLPAVDFFSSLDWKGVFTACLFLFTLFALIQELLPPDHVLLIVAGILLLAGIVTPTEFLEGFSQDIIITIAMLCVLVKALERNGFLGLVSRYVLSSSTAYWKQLLSIIFPVGAASAFINNTPIVLMMTSAVRRWALEMEKSPSKFLIPLSYAAILGGMCTLIGTSSNLIVDGLLRKYDPDAAFGFFELSLVGLPIAAIGTLFLLFFSRRLLPDRIDPTSAMEQKGKEFASEFLIEEGCPIIGKTVREVGRTHFQQELLIEIERGSFKLEAPSPDEILLEGDRLVFVGDINHIASLHQIEGLRSMADPHFKLDLRSPHFSEVVISVTSSLVGKTLKQADFRRNYGASVVAVFRQGRHLQGHVGDLVLFPGDTLILLSSRAWRTGESYANEFYYIYHNEPVQISTKWGFGVSTGTMCLMIVAVLLGVPMMVASLAAAMIVLSARTLTLRQAQRSITWNLLILIACAHTLAGALQKTGVAFAFAAGILNVVGTGQTALIATVFCLTMLLTAFITNNAAVFLLLPIALETANLAGYSTVEAMKAIGVTIAVASSCSFATPIGYQTNMIVYGPGGYRFRDYLVIGLPLSFIVLVVALGLIPYFWPLAV